MQQVIELGSERNVGTSIDLPKLVSSSCVTVRDSIPSHFASSSTPWQPRRLPRFDELEPSRSFGFLPANCCSYFLTRRCSLVSEGSSRRLFPGSLAAPEKAKG